MRSYLCFVVSSIWALSACGGGHSMDQMMGEIGQEVSGVKQKIDVHRASTAVGTDLAALVSLEGTQIGEVEKLIDTLTHGANDMKSCTSGGQTPNVTELASAVAEAKTECTNHKAAIGKAVDLAAARAEETRFQTAMAQIISRLMTQHEGLSKGAAAYSCPAHHHDEPGSSGH